MGSTLSDTVLNMGNIQARKRIKALDFDYLAKNTAFFTLEILEGYYIKLNDKYPDGKMDKVDFVETFHVAFPERPADKVDKLADHLGNNDGKISIANMLILFTCSATARPRTTFSTSSTSSMRME